MRRLIAVAALAALTGCGSGKASDQVQIKVDQSPFRITIFQNGKLLVAEDSNARLRYQLNGTGEQHSLTNVISSKGDVYRVATNEPGRTATVTVAATPTGARIDVAVHPAAGIALVIDAFDTKPHEHFLGGGERGQAVDLREQILSNVVNFNCSYAPIPYFSSSAGWGLRIASQFPSAMAFPGSTGGYGCQVGGQPECSFPPLTDRAEVCLAGNVLHERIYAGTPQQVLTDYEAETGSPGVPPPSLLALIKWRDVITGPADVLEDIKRLRAARVPLGWVLVDNPWETCNGALTFDRTRIPDPAGLIRQVHALGLKFMLWVSPRATCPDGYPGVPLGQDSGRQVLDLRNPAVVEEYRRRIRALVALGVDGVKADRGDENDLHDIDLALTNDYALLYAKAVMGALPPGTPAIFRAGTVGSQSVVPGLWAGDQPQQFVGLQRAVVAGLTAGVSGFPTWGSDVGGYSAPPGVDTELFVRWAQLGAVSPIMEVGGVGLNSTPWLLGPDAMTGLRDAAVLHYELFPYLYGLLQAHQLVLRPLAWDYPQDQRSWGSNYELMVGPDLLAAPVVGPGETPTVYLPPGSWVDLYTGSTIKGGAAPFTRATPLSQFPFYARAGAVVPFNLRAQTRSWWGTDELTHPGRAGFLATNGATLDLSGQPHDVQLFVPAGAPPGRVTLDGKDVPWSWNDGPLRGVVVRVHGPSVQGTIALSPS